MLIKWLIEQEEKQKIPDTFAVTTSSSSIWNKFDLLPNMPEDKANQLARYFEYISARYRTELVYMILVHKRTCYYCQKSMPFWHTMDAGLRDALDNYYSDIVEMTERKQLKNGQIVTGKLLFDKFKAEGTPFILANGSVKNGKFRKFPEGFRIIWDVMVQPFRILAKMFEIPKNI